MTRITNEIIVVFVRTNVLKIFKTKYDKCRRKEDGSDNRERKKAHSGS